MTDTASETVTLDEEGWSDLVERTNGAVAACYQCGVCTATCPWGSMDGGPVPVRTMMRRAQLGVNGHDEQIYRCLTCKACEKRCPRGVNITDAIVGLREKTFEEAGPPGELQNALWSVYEENNPWDRPASDRGSWMEELPDHVDVPVGTEAQVLYYVGCAPSYDPALQSLPSALVQLLQAAEVDATVLGDEEVCCGDVVRQTGEADFSAQLAEMNAETFEETNAELIVTSSPHCAETFRDTYDLNAHVVHYTEYLKALWEHNRLQFDDLNRSVTYHDPCYLARGMNVVESPRTLLKAAGANIIEMSKSGMNTLCCGGGGGQMWRETELEERFSDRRAKQAGKTGAEELVTACPYCLQMLEDGVKTTNVDLPVRDLATVLLEALDTDHDPDVDTTDDMVVEVETEVIPEPTRKEPTEIPPEITPEAPAEPVEPAPTELVESTDGTGGETAETEDTETIEPVETDEIFPVIDEPIIPDGCCEDDILDAWEGICNRNVVPSDYVLEHFLGNGE